MVNKMDMAVAAYERMVTAESSGIHRTKLIAMFDAVDSAIKTKDYEYLDNFLIQVEPAEIPTMIVPLLRTTFHCHRHLITWAQLRDRAWNADSSKSWHHTMRGLDPKNAHRYTEFLDKGGYAGVLVKLGA